MATQQTQQFDSMEAIIDATSRTPDTLMTIHNVHVKLYEKYKTLMSDPSKRDDTIRELKEAFRKIQNEYDNIYRIFRGTGEYLIWSLKSRDEILQGLDSLQTYEDYLRNGIQSKTSVFQNDSIEYRRVFPNIEAELQLPKEETVLEKIIKMVNVRNLTFVSDCETLDGNLNAVQYLIQANQLDLLRRIHDLSKIPLSTKTVKTNETCSQLAMATGNCEMVEFVITNIYQQRINSLQYNNDFLKEEQAKLYDQRRGLLGDIQSLRIECESSRVSRLMNQIKSYLIFFMIIYFMFFQ